MRLQVADPTTGAPYPLPVWVPVRPALSYGKVLGWLAYGCFIVAAVLWAIGRWS